MVVETYPVGELFDVWILFLASDVFARFHVVDTTDGSNEPMFVSTRDWERRACLSPKSEGVYIVIPTLNEAANIVPLLKRIAKELKRPYRICIVDDGSKDGTLDQVRSFVQSVATQDIHVIERRKMHAGSQRGAAVMAGLQFALRHSDFETFVEMDADLSHRPEELETGIEAIQSRGFSVAIASKYVHGSMVVNRPLRRRSLSALYNWLNRTLISPGVRDWSNGYRFYDRAAAEIICKLKYGSPVWLVEVLATLLARGMRITEFPSIYVGRGEGLSKMRWVDIGKAAIALLDISVKYHLGFLSGE